jgi:hypothetical protein
VKNPLNDFGLGTRSPGSIPRPKGTARGGSFSLWSPSKPHTCPMGTIPFEPTPLTCGSTPEASYYSAALGTGGYGASLG